MSRPRLALFLGILCISVFPVIVRLGLTSALTSAFYRLAIAAALLLPFAFFTKKLRLENLKIILPITVCGLLFASDIAVWNISIQHSSATQATLLTNLSPLWVGLISFFFLGFRPQRGFWAGTVLALFGMAVFVGPRTILHLDFDYAFGLGILSGVLYALYLLLSKKVLAKIPVVTFMSYSMAVSSIFLAAVTALSGEAFTGFTPAAWLSLLVQGVICQLIAWLLISFATQKMRPTRVSLSLLSQAIFAALLAALFLGERITLLQLVGSAIMLAGIALTFVEKAPETETENVDF